MTARAEEISRAAFAAASRGELHRAVRLGRQALAIDGTSAQLWRATGLAALAIGDAGEAAASLRVAQSLDADSDAGRWLQSIERGPARGALNHYNTALEQSKNEQFDKAIESAESALRDLPSFVPAARLLGLLHAQQGRIVEARRAWHSALQTCSDDREIMRLLALTSVEYPVEYLAERPAEPAGMAEPTRTRRPSVGTRAQKFVLPWVTIGLVLLTAIAAFIGVATTRAKPPAAVDTTRAPLATRADSVALARALGQILAAESDSAVDALRALEPHTSQWPAAARARAAAIGHERGRTHFVAGEKAFNSGQWRAAARDLSWAVTYGDGSDYHAAAMYLLARSHARTSQPSSAKLEAQELLRRYPQSKYADGVMRAIAATGREP